LKNRTKILFAETFERMIKTTPINKIRIVDLCEECDTIPQTFYYHFHDKYELIAWIFLRDFSRTYDADTPEYSISSIIDNLTNMDKRKSFYQKTYTDDSQNSINQYIQTFNLETAKVAIETVFKTNLSKKQLYEIKYHSYGTMGLFKEWLNDDTFISITDLATFQYDHTPEFLKIAYQKFSFKDTKFIK
jgi:hypothetical protein